MYWQTSFMEIFIQKPLVVGKLSLFSGMQNDALMHREGLKDERDHHLVLVMVVKSWLLFLLK